MAGVANWRTAMPLAWENGAEQISLAFDHDEREETHKAVERNLVGLREALLTLKVRVRAASCHGEPGHGRRAGTWAVDQGPLTSLGRHAARWLYLGQRRCSPCS